MTFQDFRLWLAGFNDAIDGAPDIDKWHTFLAKLDEVDASAVSENATISIAPRVTETIPRGSE